MQRSNLKRRVYDSINVLYESDIVLKRVEMVLSKKQSFYKPNTTIGKLPLLFLVLSGNS